MADMVPFQNTAAASTPKSFWQRPEGITGAIFMGGLLLGGGYLLYKILPTLIALAANTLYLALMLMAIGAIIYMVLDPRMRNLVWYGYKSIMRAITGMFVQIDPIGILKSYCDDLKNNLGKMSQQIGNLRGQMRKLQTLMEQNTGEINNQLKMASLAQQKSDQTNMVLSTRKAARLKESNEKYDVLYKKMEVLYRILTKMYQNSEIVLEDTQDQVRVKEIEYKAIKTSHSAMSAAMSVMNGNPDQRAMFEMAMENITNDVANKVGEMERFMEMSNNFMNSVDLQNGVFQEEGLKMLEDWEKQSSLLLLPDTGKKTETLDLNVPTTRKIEVQSKPSSNGEAKGGSNYDNLFS